MPDEREVAGSRATSAISIMVVSDVRLFREGLAASLAQRAGLVVVCTASYADEASLLEKCHADVLVLDMAARGSLDVIRRVSTSLNTTRTIAFAIEEAERDVLRCAECGAAGFVPVDGTMEDLVNTILSVARGEMLCSPRVAATLLRALHARSPDAESERLVLTLTAREREIAPLLERGFSNKEIAAQLRIELATVKNHVHNVLEKLQVTSRGEAAARLRSRPAATTPTFDRALRPRANERGPT